MTSTDQPVSIIQAEWLKTGVIVHFSDDVSANFPSEFLRQHRSAFLLPDTPDEDLP